MKIIDLRSDTVTRPTPEMLRAMVQAPLGDDGYGDDPTVNQLEELAARTLVKEAAIFMPTGVMGNQAAVMTHTRPGDEIIASRHCHIISHEAGGPARLSGVWASLTETPEVSPDDIRRLIKPVGNVHLPRSRLLCLENALSNGGLVSLADLKRTFETAKEYGLAVHLDGARLFNAAVALGVDAAELAACADSVMFCISKGLCAPVGSLVCGPADFIAEMRRCRKVLGGAMRQSGVLAACGLVALSTMVGRLAEDHENARRLGRLLATLPGLSVDLESIKINMVYWKPEAGAFQSGDLAGFLKDRGILVNEPDNPEGIYRLVTHHDIQEKHLFSFVEALREFMATRIK